MNKARTFLKNMFAQLIGARREYVNVGSGDLVIDYERLPENIKIIRVRKKRDLKLSFRRLIP